MNEIIYDSFIIRLNAETQFSLISYAHFDERRSSFCMITNNSLLLSAYLIYNNIL